MSLPRIVITGASGFIGRHLLDALKENYHIHAMGRRSQIRCGAPFHDNIIWHQVDIGYADALRAEFETIKADGRIDFVLHLAAHYDFTGENHPEYHRTNVVGLRNVLENCRLIKPKRFILSSSVAACDFPEPGQVLNEDSPPDGDHIYAKTKAIGEAMLEEFSDEFPCLIVRFAALFSDWCAYPPLYMFLGTWRSKAWNSCILGGRGESAIPYLHIKDAVRFMRLIFLNDAKFHNREVLIASPDGAVSHRELYDVVSTYEKDKARSPVFTPKFLVLPGILVMRLLSRLTGNQPFEKPWMAKYVDKKLTIDASRTRERMGWEPRKRLDVLFRMAFLIENQKYDPMEWTRINRDAMKEVRVRPNLKIHSLLEKHKDEIAETFIEAIKARYPSYKLMDDKEHDWSHRLIMRNLRNAIRLRVKADFMFYCRDLAERRIAEGFRGEELVGALETLNEVCLKVLEKDPDADDMRPFTPTCISMTVQFGIDQVTDIMDDLENGDVQVEHYRGPSETGPGCPL